MERGIKCSDHLRLKKPERKVMEKNRRNHMKFLSSRLFSLVPPHLISKGGDQVSDRVDTTINYIETLKTNLEIDKGKKEKLTSRKRSHEHAQINMCKSVFIQVHEMSQDLDAVLITGIKNHSSFCHVVQLLSQYSSEITLANFSISGHSTFHIRHKKIEAEEISNRLKMLLEEGYSEMKELRNNYASSSFEQLETNLSIWDFNFDFEFESNVWGWELQTELLPMNIPLLEEY